MFTKEDQNQIKNKGISPDNVVAQIKFFENGFPFVNIFQAAQIENRGVLSLNPTEIKRLSAVFDQYKQGKTILKFVPASGAASRMFKQLFSFKESYDASETAYNNYLNDTGFNSAFKFINEIQHFSFYNDLKEILNKHQLDIDALIKNKDFNPIIDFLLSEKGLQYALLPKGLLKFHSYGDYSRTAFEEHLVEAFYYALNDDGNAHIHFTVSPEHLEKFNSHLAYVKNRYENEFKIKYQIQFSIQKESTDTIAVDIENKPFRDSDGSLLFRPAGHGALIDNLNELDCDIVFIKNIDNIVPDRLKPETILYKKALAAYLMEVQTMLHKYLHLLNSEKINEATIAEMVDFAKDYLHMATDNIDKQQLPEYLKTKFNRPIRVCGMVKNEGEPGGGPFWVKNKNNEISLQIVESSQIDLSNTQQKEIVSRSTHFNPVDLVCGIKDYCGNKFDLKKYVDPDTGFISIKSKNGKDLKAMELPGLWNGAMADWITIFVEVPIITFNPVKTINDLLRKEHQ